MGSVWILCYSLCLNLCLFGPKSNLESLANCQIHEKEYKIDPPYWLPCSPSGVGGGGMAGITVIFAN